MNPVSRLLAGIVAVLALVGALFFGIFVLALVVGIGLIAWAVLWLRMWWLKRTMPRDSYGQNSGVFTETGGTAGSAERKGDVIDAEYKVVSRDEDV